MALAADLGASLPGLTKLTFDRTLDRRLLHRNALSEVFLTDCFSVDKSLYLAAAQLPPKHPYYTDHVQPGVIDPMLLLECARQAETYGGHAHLGVPLGTSFVLRRWSVSLRGIGAESTTMPAALRMAVRTRGARYLDGRLRSVTYDIQLFLDRAPAGVVEIDVAYLPATTYRAVRARHRAGNTPPTSADLPSPPQPGRAPVEPARVGRSAASDVVLYEPVLSDDTAEAAVRIPLGNPSMFDHPQDHLPGMVMMEAARQLGTLLLGDEGTASPHRVYLVGLESSFSAYAELDELTVLRVRGRRTDGAARADGRQRMHITFHQRDQTIADSTLTFVTRPEVR